MVTLLDRFARDEWNIGVVHQSVADIVRRGIQEPVTWFPYNSWRILADPFCLTNADGSITVYAELLNHWLGKGEIVSATIASGDDLCKAALKRCVVGPAHLSYPNYVQDGTTHYAIMESFEAGGLFLWRRDGATWHYVKTLLTRPAIDATIYRDVDRWWLFCTFADDGPDERLHLFYADSLLGEWTPHPMNPIKNDRANARPAGALFVVDGQLIRPAQDSSVTYGGRLILNHVRTLTADVFDEVPYRIIVPQSKYYKDGIHTITAAGQYTIIDGKRWHRGLSNLPCRVSAKLFKIYRRCTAGNFVAKMRFYPVSQT